MTQRKAQNSLPGVFMAWQELVAVTSQSVMRRAPLRHEVGVEGLADDDHPLLRLREGPGQTTPSSTGGRGG